MARPHLEVADIFRAHGAAWRKANAGHLSLAQLKVMSAIETCRTAALGGHVERREDCAHDSTTHSPTAGCRQGNGTAFVRGGTYHALVIAMKLCWERANKLTDLSVAHH